jgi:Zn-dependent protease with chaperone function
MQSHEFFHEQAHVEKRHELKRRILLLALISAVFIIYRFFCHQQEFEADCIAAEKCGKKKAIESLKFLQIHERKRGFWANLLALHPRTERRIRKF